jgi:hypothetical protein
LPIGKQLKPCGVQTGGIGVAPQSIILGGNMAFQVRRIKMKRKTIVTAALLCATLFVPLSLFGQDFEMNGTVLVKYRGNAANVTIPAGVTAIGDFAFRGYSGLTSVTIPSSVTAIGEGAFYQCSSLTSITIPVSVTSIRNETFAFCYNLISVIIPASITSIEIDAFAYCSGLTSITIPSSVTSIGNFAFYECTSLTSVTIPSSVISIGDFAFNNSDAVINNLRTVTVSRKTTIGKGAFPATAQITYSD